MSRTPASTAGWLPTMPTALPPTRAKPHVKLMAQCGKYSMYSPPSTIAWMILQHVVGLIGGRRNDVAELRHLGLGVLGAFTLRRELEVVGREKREQVTHVVEARLLVCGHERGHARAGGVAHGATELLEGHFLARHRLHDIGAGDEHVTRLVHHEDEIRHRR